MYERGPKRSISDKRRLQLYTWEAKLRKGLPVSVEDALKVYELMKSGTGVARGFKELRAFPRDAMVTMADLKSHGGLLRDDIWHEAFDQDTQITGVEKEYIRSCLRNKERMSDAPRIRLSTIHGSKGGEAAEVVLITDMAPRTYREALALPDDEARVWYVAATRAKQKLTVVRPLTDRHFTLRAW